MFSAAVFSQDFGEKATHFQWLECAIFGAVVAKVA